MYTLDVDASTPYRVHIGTFLLERVGAIAREAAGGRRAVIVTDSNVGPLYAAPVKTGLEEAGYETGVFTFEAGERSKRAQTYISILEYLASRELTRTDVVVALGGGAVRSTSRMSRSRVSGVRSSSANRSASAIAACFTTSPQPSAN